MIRLFLRRCYLQGVSVSDSPQYASASLRVEVPRLKLVARGVLGGLALLEEAGIVHNAAGLKVLLSPFSCRLAGAVV